MTWNDFIALPEDDLRELVDGRLVVTETPTKWHEVICAQLIRSLSTWSDGREFVVLGSAYKVKVSDTRGAMPDVQMLSRVTYDEAGANGLEGGHPELVVEVISPGSKTHDGVRKLDWYASLGVPEYWLVDPENRTLVVHRLQNNGYAIVQHAEGDVVFRSRSFKGLTISLKKLWANLPKR
ncbi:MAG: Uma2 family endonuclease [Archangium sp.]